MRDHKPNSIDSFNGLYNRGDFENTPKDHFQGSNNLRHQGASVMTREGINISQDILAVTPLTNIRRIYNYPMNDKNTLIVLSYDPLTNVGKIYHVIDLTTQFGPVLTKTGMKDFAFVSFGGRAYISPFSSSPSVSSVPATALTATAHAGVGIDAGSHTYGVTFFNGSGETTVSPLTGVIASAALTDPTIAPTTVDLYPPSIQSPMLLDVGKAYKWKFTYIHGGSSAETNVSPVSLGLLITAGPHAYMLRSTDVPPTHPLGIYINIYRCIGDNFTTFYREFTGVPLSLLNTVIFLGSTFSDAAIVSQPQAPSANGTSELQFTLNNIPISPATVVTGRKIYRSAANLTQLKLLTTINDNTTTGPIVDSAADSTLGVNVPTTNTIVISDSNIEKGLINEFLYVYAGDGTNARKAAGSAISGAMTVAAGVGGHTDAGLHIYGVVSETISGYLSPPGALTTFPNIPTAPVSFGNIPTSGDTNVVKRHIVASKAITNFNGDLTGYDLFFIPGATINNNTNAFLNNISFYDQDLLEDASHLFDNYSQIPAGAFLSSYRGRLVLGATYDDINLVLVSAQGEPEAISQIDGILATQPNGFPVSNAAELRDVLYIFRPNSTMAFNDNGDEPSTWLLVNIDAALGTRPHGISQFINNSTQNVDFLIIATYQGISLFTGTYQTPELSWKISSFWQNLDRANFGNIQIANNIIKKRIYIILPDRNMLVGFFQNGLSPKAIQWEPWTFAQPINTVAVTLINDDILGSDIY